VPAKVTPPSARVHADPAADDDDAPSAKQRTLAVDMPSNAVALVLGVKVYEVVVDVRAAAGETVARVHVGPAVYPDADPLVACATVNCEK
jgi:hypothetical protein